MDPLYLVLHASRARAVTGLGAPRRCESARTAAAWLLTAFACLALPIPALAAEAAVHQKLESVRGATAAAERARPYWTAPLAVRETPDSLLYESDDDDDDDEAIRIQSAWTRSLARSSIVALHTSIASPVILTGGSSLRGPPATTSFTS